MTSDDALLTGYLRAVPEQPGFVLLVFRAGTGNESLTQIVGADDRVVGFRSVDFTMTPSEPDQQNSLRLGDEALWGYAFPDAPPNVGRRSELVRWLRERVDAVSDPLLRLQAAEFCGLVDERHSAWRASFEHMSLIAPRSAVAWRDVIVLPAQVRASVARVIGAHGIDATNDLSRDVTVRVGGDRLIVSIEGRLFDALQAHPAALTAIDHDTVDVRHAFGLHGPVVTVASESSNGGYIGGQEAAPVVVAIGERAQRVLRRLIRSIEGAADDSAISRRARRHGGPAPLTIWDADRLTFEGDVDLQGLDGHLPPRDQAERPDVLVVFGATARESDVARHAVRLARTVDGRRYRRIAVMPHLPDSALTRSPDEYERFLSSLAEAFDAVFVLSDHSPHLRYGLPYGPSRSYEAAAARLRTLISELEAGSVEIIEPLVMSASEGLPVHVLSSTSSSGSLSGRRLFEYAIGGATAFSLERTPSTRLSLVLTRDEPRDEAASLEKPVRRAGFSDLHLTYHRTWPASRGTSANVHLADARWRPSASGGFEKFCISELEGQGWLVTKSDGARTDVEIERRGVRIAIEFKAFSVDPDARPLRASAKQRRGEDIVLVTDSAVHRGDYVRHVLQGRLPIGVSRLNVLQTVYVRRYAYLIRALRGNDVRYRNRILDAAFARSRDTSTVGYDLRIAGLVSVMGGRDVTIDADDSRITVLRDAVRVDLRVRMTSAAGDGSRHAVSVVLAESGWQIGRWSLV